MITGLEDIRRKVDGIIRIRGCGRGTEESVESTVEMRWKAVCSVFEPDRPVCHLPITLLSPG
jgi:hypothetical protein